MIDYLPQLFSLLFFLVTAIYLFLGFYVIQVNRKAGVNQAFLFVCLALSIWSFGIAMGNLATNLETVLFWRRFAAIGWVAVYSLSLHFILLLTCKECSDRKKRLFFLLHLPVLIALWVFSFSGSMAAIQYDFVKTNSGWINQAASNGWNYFYYFYYLTYGFLSLFLIWRWRKKATDQKIIQQATFIFIALLLSGFLAILTDFILIIILKQTLPQMAPIFLLIPLVVMYYAVKHSDLMQTDPAVLDQVYLTELDRQEIFRKLALAFLLGGITIFLSEFIPAIALGNNNFLASLKASSLTFSIGVGLFLIQKINDDCKRQNLTIILLVISIPLISLQFIEYSGITIWVFPVLIMIASLIFTKRNLLISATLVAIITQGLLWIFQPENTITLYGYDYALRILLFVFVFLIGFYVNRIYMTKIKEHMDQTAFQKLSSDLSLDFVSLDKDSFDDKITNLLKQLALFFNVDRTYLFLIDHSDSTMTYTHEWCNVGIEPEVGTIEKIPLSVFPWWIGQLEDRKMVYIEDVSQMPAEAIEEQNQLIRQKVKSLVSLPVEGRGEIQGFIGIDSVNSFKIWSDDHLEMLNLLANLLAQGLNKKHDDEEIEFMAYYDHLTGIPNRVLFADRLNQALYRSKRTKTFVCTIFIDLDNFKTVNDTMGHSGGDDLLKAVAQSLLGHVRKMDTVCRFGGDEFLIMLSDIKSIDDIPEIAQKIMALFDKPFIVQNQEFFVTASAGVSISPLDGEDAETLIKNADIAMYQAKDLGKNQYALCTTAMKEDIKQSMLLSNDLYRALARNELVVYYQPQVDLQTKEINGVEALLRWFHPDHGLISPGVFIPLAEKSSLINTIGDWVLKTACRQNKKWQDLGFVPLKMGVNLSGIQFANSPVVESVKNALAESDLDPKYLEIEITESIAIENASYTITVLNQLKDLGVSIAIDDFGTEYSSLSRLKELPIDRIKIDIQFIRGLEHNAKDQAITLVIINLAKSLGLNVIAEGVETLPQLDFLNQKMCDQVQGFYYYKPMPAAEIEKILKKIPHHSDGK